MVVKIVVLIFICIVEKLYRKDNKKKILVVIFKIKTSLLKAKPKFLLSVSKSFKVPRQTMARGYSL